MAFLNRPHQFDAGAGEAAALRRERETGSSSPPPRPSGFVSGATPRHSGWTGRKCPKCFGYGERFQDGEEKSCPDCAGTGEEHITPEPAHPGDDEYMNPNDDSGIAWGSLFNRYPTPAHMATTMNDESMMPFGKHKGLKLMHVPADYLLWIWDRGPELHKQQGGLADYIRNSFAALEQQAPDVIVTHRPERP